MSTCHNPASKHLSNPFNNHIKKVVVDPPVYILVSSLVFDLDIYLILAELW